MVDIDVFVEFNDIKACHRFEKLDKDKFQKTLLSFLTGKTVKSYCSIKRGLSVLIAVSNNLSQSIKTFASENLTLVNESS